MQGESSDRSEAGEIRAVGTARRAHNRMAREVVDDRQRGAVRQPVDAPATTSSLSEKRPQWGLPVLMRLDEV